MTRPVLEGSFARNSPSGVVGDISGSASRRVSSSTTTGLGASGGGDAYSLASLSNVSAESGMSDFGGSVCSSSVSPQSSRPVSPSITEEEARGSYHQSNKAATGAPTNANKWVFKTFVLLNFVTFLDRAIIPGASTSFAAFVAGSTNEQLSEHPDVGIGMLQASFIIGYSIAMVLCGHLVHTIPWKTLTTIGLLCWMGGVLVSGLSYYAKSFNLLVIARTTSGMAEASFQIVAPPLILERGGIEAGKWLGYYLTATPVGVAIGYIYGSAMSTTIGWQWAYLFLVVASLPLLYSCRLMPSGGEGNDNGILAVVPHPSRRDKGAAMGSSDLTGLEEQQECSSSKSDKKLLSFKQKLVAWWRSSRKLQNIKNLFRDVYDEIWACISSEILLCIIFAYAAYVSVLSTLGTFGGAFILGLELFDSEFMGALWFGLAVAIAGMIGTPLGGRIVDRLQEKHRGLEGNNNDNDDNEDDILAILTKYIALGTLVGACVAWPSVICNNPALFIGFVFGGWIFLFGVQTAIMECIMLSVNEKQYRPNAIASSTLLCHLLGDVPAPIIFGAIKDNFAPACVVTETGALVDLASCRGQHVGIRITLAICYAWLTWTVLFFLIARHLSLRRKEKRKNLKELKQQSLQKEFVMT